MVPVQGQAADLQVPCLQGQKTHQQFQQGGLSHPIAADEPHLFPWFQSKGQVVEYRDSGFFRARQGILEADMGQFENGRHGQDSFSSRMDEMARQVIPGSGTPGTRPGSGSPAAGWRKQNFRLRFPESGPGIPGVPYFRRQSGPGPGSGETAVPVNCR